MKLLYLRYEPTHSDFILDASAIKTIVIDTEQQNIVNSFIGGAR